MTTRKFYILFILTLLTACNVAFAQESRDSVKIYFSLGRSVLDTSIRENNRVLNYIRDSLRSHYADAVYRLKDVSVVGGASPEGSVKLNNRLSEKRASSVFEFLSENITLPSTQNKLTTHLGRDWRGLLTWVLKDENVPYKEDVIALLQNIIYKSQDGEREDDDNYGRLLRLKGGEPYRYLLKTAFPELRASYLVLQYDRIPNSLKMNNLMAVQPLWEPTLPTQQVLRFTPPLKESKKGLFMALKTNMLCDAMLVPNIGMEFHLGSNYSLSANWMYAWWKNDNKNFYWRTYGGDLAIRKYFGPRAKQNLLTGHHLGVYGQIVTYDLLLGNRTGILGDKWSYAAGVEYGYSLPVAKRLNIDFSIGVGYLTGEYKEYLPIDDCYVWQKTKNRKWVGPTKAEVSLVWLIGKGAADRCKKGGNR